VYSEDDLLPISALQHLAFCRRQWGLIHLEQQWSDNRLTAEGTLSHERAHDEATEVRGDLHIARGLRLRSLRLGLVGQADVVEFHKTEDKSQGIPLEGVSGLWQPVIVEYKHGKPKIGHEDEVQLCAQAICLEEMLGVTMSAATLFYGQPRRRFDVNLSSELRTETQSLVVLLHELTLAGITPPPEYSHRCHSCSLIDVCLPGIFGSRKSVNDYITKAIQSSGDIG